MFRDCESATVISGNCIWAECDKSGKTVLIAKRFQDEIDERYWGEFLGKGFRLDCQWLVVYNIIKLLSWLIKFMVTCSGYLRLRLLDDDTTVKSLEISSNWFFTKEAFVGSFIFFKYSDMLQIGNNYSALTSQGRSVQSDFMICKYTFDQQNKTFDSFEKNQKKLKNLWEKLDKVNWNHLQLSTHESWLKNFQKICKIFQDLNIFDQHTVNSLTVLRFNQIIVTSRYQDPIPTYIQLIASLLLLFLLLLHAPTQKSSERITKAKLAQLRFAQWNKPFYFASFIETRSIDTVPRQIFSQRS